MKSQELDFSHISIVLRISFYGKRGAFTLNSERCIEYCLDTVDIPEDKWLLQDGARCHTSKTTKAHHQEKGTKVVQNAAYSPNLNPIELVWKEVHSLIGKRCPLTEEELRKAILEAWEELPQSKIDKICGHFDTELANVKEQQ